MKWPSSTPFDIGEAKSKMIFFLKVTPPGPCLSVQPLQPKPLVCLRSSHSVIGANAPIASYHSSPFFLGSFPCVFKEPCMVVLGRRDQCQPATQSCLRSGTSLDGRRWWLNKEECDWGYCDVLPLVSSPSDCSQYVSYFVPFTVKLARLI